MEILKVQCPFCQWSVRQEIEQSSTTDNRENIQSMVAKALVHHLMVRHARHEMKKADNVTISSSFGSDNQRGHVELAINDEMTQMEVSKAKEVHRMLGEAIEAAITDEMIMTFFKEELDLPPKKLATLLYRFREIRQGSKNISNPF